MQSRKLTSKNDKFYETEKMMNDVINRHRNAIKQTEQNTFLCNEIIENMIYNISKTQYIKYIVGEFKETYKNSLVLAKVYVDLIKDYILISTEDKSYYLSNEMTYYALKIIKYYQDAYNFDDLMNPPLTELERELLIEDSTEGMKKLVEIRCIDNIPLERRPIHSINTPGSIFLVRNNNKWSIDINGDLLFHDTYEKTNEFLKQHNISDKQE
jgi:hypothetical protein